MQWSRRSRSPLEAALLAAALVGVALVAFAGPTGAVLPGAPPAVPTGITENISLYGAALSGWGYAANNTTNPGPHLYVTYGDTIQLTLFAADGATHTWFLDYNNNSLPDAGEPISHPFSPGNSVLFNFTPDRVGTYVYRCSIHPTSMLGLITISAPTRYTLYGNALTGWGFSPTNLTKPGPTLMVQEGVNITLTLHSADNATHTWFIDYDNDSTVNGGETPSPPFGGAGNPNPLVYNFIASRSGTYAYRCGIHLSTMWGMIVVLGAPAPPAAGFPIPLIPGIMLGVIAGVIVLAGVYQVRTTRAVRLKK